MTRQWCIECEGAYHHILSREIERRNIFDDNDDREGLWVRVLLS